VEAIEKRRYTGAHCARGEREGETKDTFRCGRSRFDNRLPPGPYQTPWFNIALPLHGKRLGTQYHSATNENVGLLEFTRVAWPVSL